MINNTERSAQLRMELDSVLSAVAGKARLPSLCVDVDIAGARISYAYRDSGRPVTGDERPVFLSGCLVDMFVAMICLDLHLRSGLNMDAPIGKIAPELAALSTAEAPITVRHLLTRTSGLQDPRTVAEMRTAMALETFAERVLLAAKLFSPGVAFSYGGVDLGLLALVLQRYAGDTLERVARKSIVEASNVAIRDIQYGPAEPDGFRAIVAFDSSTLIEIVARLAGRGSARNPFAVPLRKALAEEQLTLSHALKAYPWPHAPVAFTCGLFRFSDGLVGFNGWDRNHSCAVRYDPESEVSFVVALEGPPAVRDAVVSDIAERLGFVCARSRGTSRTLGSLNGLARDAIVGRYTGWAMGYEALVTVEKDIVSCEISYRGEKFQRVSARLEEEEWLVSDTAMRPSALEFFLDRGTGRVCFASGLLPYAKSDKAA
jgi:hypothetical protein